jgi:two-component sensor histidine kinase
MVIRYASIESSVLTAAERLLGAGMVGFAMRKETCPFWIELIERGEPVFVSDAVDLAAASMPDVLKPVIAQAFRLGGWSNDDFVIWLPLSTANRIEGGLAVWGPDLRPEDMPTLSVFASQVGITVENVRLYTAERQRAEENEVLLKEVHHRVKNNLQVVSSLLRLQSSHFDDARIVEAFAESQDRIRSMSLVHEKLYQSADLAQIDFGDYVRDLAVQLLETYCASADGVSLAVEVEDIALDIDQAISCGLILNELLSNAIKHAFPGERTGDVRVEMRARAGQISLLVSDNGVGLPDDLDVEQSDSLGLELVHALTQQLDGTLNVENRDGCTVSILFAAE